MQIQGQSAPADMKYKGMFQTIALISKEEGVFSLFKGLSAGLQR